MSLLTPEIREQLIANGKRHGYDQNQQINNVPPVCFIYDELSSMSWLLTEIDRLMPSIAWGIIDTGDGKPDFQSFSLTAIENGHEVVPNTGGTQCLTGWEPQGMLSEYMAAAARSGRIVELDGRPLAPERHRDVRPLSDHSDAELEAIAASHPRVKAGYLGMVGWFVKAHVRHLLGFRR